MKKVFLSLAAIAVLTVVSCKKTETEEVVTDSIDTTLVVTDSAAVMEVDSTQTVDTVAVPATEAPAAH